MKKLMIIICLVACVFAPVQNAMSKGNGKGNNDIVTVLDFDDDDFPEFINF